MCSASARPSRSGGDRAGGDPVAEQLMLSREQLSPIYQRLQSAGDHRQRPVPVGGAPHGAGEHRPRDPTDSYELRFPRELKVRSDVLAVGHDCSGTLVQIAYAIAGKGLEPVTVTRGYLYSVRVRFSATRPHGPGRGVARHHPALRRPRAGARR